MIILIFFIPFIGIIYSATGITYFIAKKSKLNDYLFSLVLIVITLWSGYLWFYGDKGSGLRFILGIIINILGILFTLFYLWRKE